MSQELFDFMAESLVRHEHPVPHLYLDSLGHLTIGIGHLVIKSNEALISARLEEELRLILRAEFGLILPEPMYGPAAPTPGFRAGRKASSCERRLAGLFESAFCVPGEFSPDVEPMPAMVEDRTALGLRDSEKVVDFLREEAMAVLKDAAVQPKKGYGWWHWTSRTRWRMSMKGMMALKRHDFFGLLNGIPNRYAGVRNRFTGFDEYPLPAQAAIMDVAFQRGDKGALNLLGAASARGEWSELAKARRSAALSEYKERNLKRAEWFEAAAKQVDAAKAKLSPPGATPSAPSTPTPGKKPPVPIPKGAKP